MKQDKPCLRESRPQGEGDVFHSVVVINPGVPSGLDCDVKQSMGGQLVQHVIQEAYWRLRDTLARAIQVDGHLHLRLLGHALCSGNAGWALPMVGQRGPAIGLGCFCWGVHRCLRRSCCEHNRCAPRPTPQVHKPLPGTGPQQCGR
eukprot:1159328-Pelagomonas_calceolata.AAC.4